jgi:circadian clock protein KaiB
MATSKKLPLQGEAPRKVKYEFSLYVAGPNPQSLRAVTNIKEILEKFPGQYELKVVNIYEHPALAGEDQIICAPTLVKKRPGPVRKFIGDLSNKEKILKGLDQ